MNQPSTPSTRYHALDAWRGIVCLIVVLEHAGVALWSEIGSVGGYDGVARTRIVQLLMMNVGAPLFFVISGYCIASSLDSSRRKGTSPMRFLARRLWRIFPPYWASVLIIGLLVVILDRLGLESLHQNGLGLEIFAPGQLDRWQWLGNVTLTETWRPLVLGSYTLLVNRVAWALCYQEQFYLICFLCLVFAPKRLHGALAWATLAIVAYRVFAWDSGRLELSVGLFPDLWHEFAVGLALYWRINVARSIRSRRGVELGLIALFLIGCGSGAVTTAAAAGFGLVLIVFHRWDEQIARIGQLDPLRACGRRSYSIYLIHLPVCTVGNAVLAAVGLNGFWPRALVMIPAVTAGSVAVGWAFYALVDRRFTSLPKLAGLKSLLSSTTAIPPGIATVESPAGRVGSLSASDEIPVRIEREGRVMLDPKPVRMILVAIIALSTIGLAGDAASGARAWVEERADRPAFRTGLWGGVPDAWSKAHRKNVERARRADDEVVFLGDSITMAWSDMGTDVWRSEFEPLQATNFGFPGDRTQHLLWRIAGGELDGCPKVAVVLIGTNNLEAGQSPEDTASGIAAVVESINQASPSTRVLLVGLLPRALRADDPLRRDVDRVNAIIKGWAAKAEVDYVDIGAAFLRPDGAMRWEATIDLVHPTPAGYRLMADALRAPVRRLLGGA